MGNARIHTRRPLSSCDHRHPFPALRPSGVVFNLNTPPTAPRRTESTGMLVAGEARVALKEALETVVTRACAFPFVFFSVRFSLHLARQAIGALTTQSTSRFRTPTVSSSGGEWAGRMRPSHKQNKRRRVCGGDSVFPKSGYWPCVYASYAQVHVQTQTHRGRSHGGRRAVGSTRMRSRPLNSSSLLFVVNRFAVALPVRLVTALPPPWTMRSAPHASGSLPSWLPPAPCTAADSVQRCGRHARSRFPGGARHAPLLERLG